MTPATATIPGLSTLVVSKFDITAGSQDVSIDSILLKNTGLGSNNAVLRVALFTKDGRISRDRNFSSTTDDVNINLTSPLVVKAGTTVTVDAVVETADSTGAQGSEFAISIHSINASANVLGNLPVVGKTMKIGSINAAQATISKDATLSNVNLGEREVNVASFQIRNNESSNDIKLSSITLRDSQNKMRSNLANLSLYLGNTKLSEVAFVNDRYVTFNFNEITINSNQTARFTVKADIVGGAGDSIELFLDKKLDIAGKDTRYGFGLNFTNNYDGSSSSNLSSVSILAGDLTIVGIDASVTDIQADKKDLMIGKLKVVSNAGKNLELEKITIELERTSPTATNLNTVIDTQRVRLVNENTGSSYELDLQSSSTASNLVFSDDLYVALGQETTFAVYVDTLLGAASGTRFRVKLDTSNVSKFKIIETSDDEVVSNITPSTITLKNIEVKSTTAFINRNTMLSSRNFVIGSTNNEVVSFEVEAGTMSDVNFDLVEVRGNITALSGTGNISNTTFTQARLYHTSVSDANLVASRSASQFSNDIIRFDGFNSIVVAKDQTKKFIVTVDLADDENMDGVGAQFRLENINLRDYDNDDITVSSFVATNYAYQTTLNIQGSGDFKVNYLTTNSFNQYDKTVLAGNELTVASYELQGLNENVDVEEVIFTLSGATASETKAALNNAKLYLNNTLVATAANSKINNNEIVFDRLTSLIIPADQNSELRLVLSTNTIGFNKLGEILNSVYIDEVSFEKAEGVSSGKEITYNSADHSTTTDSRTFTVVPSTVLAAVQTTFNQSSTAQFELRVNAGQNTQTGSNSTPVVTITQLDFTKSGNRTASGYVLKDENGSVLSTGTAAGNDVRFAGFSIDITDVEKLQIEAIVTSASDDTYGLTLRRNGITYTVNGEAGLINNSEQTISFGSKN